MLTLLRDHAQSWIIKVVLGVIIITFIISFGVGQFTNQKQVLAVVGSEEILVRQFQQAYELELENLRQRFQDNADQIAQQQNLRKQVFDNMVHRILIRNAAHQRGLRVSDEEVADSIRSLEVFRAGDGFDPQLYRRILSQNRRTPQVFEAQRREDLLVSKYQRTLLAGVVVSKEEVEQRYRLENEQVETDFFRYDPKAFLAGSKSDPEAEKAYYEAHPQPFTRPAQAKVSYFILPLSAVEARVKVRQKAVERHYERFREESYTTPKQVRASHILKKLPEKPTAEQEAAAQAEMEELLTRLKKGADFAAMARKHSDDLSKEKGGDLGFFKSGEMLPEFSQAAFALKKGETSGVVRTPFGLHIIRVTDVRPAVVKPFEAVRAEIEKTLKARRAERTLELETERLPPRIAKEGLAVVAAEWKQKTQGTDWLDAGSVIEGLGPVQEMAGAANTRPKGQGGVWQRNPVQGHVFFQVDEKRPSQLLPLEQVRSQVAAKVKEERAAQAAVKAAQAAFKTMATRQDFTAVARKGNFPIQTTKFTALTRVIPEVGFNSAFRLAGLKLTKEHPAGISVSGDTAHLLFLKRRFFPQPEKEAETKQEITARLEQAWGDYFLEQEVERLKAAEGVEVVTPELVSAR